MKRIFLTTVVGVLVACVLAPVLRPVVVRAWFAYNLSIDAAPAHLPNTAENPYTRLVTSLRSASATDPHPAAN